MGSVERTMAQGATMVLERLKEKLMSALHKIERDIDRFSPPSTPRRGRSNSVCSISLPDNREIVQESLGQGLPIIPFGIPSFVILDPEEQSPDLMNRRHIRLMDTDKLEETSGTCTPPYLSMTGMDTPPILVRTQDASNKKGRKYKSKHKHPSSRKWESLRE